MSIFLQYLYIRTILALHLHTTLRLYQLSPYPEILTLSPLPYNLEAFVYLTIPLPTSLLFNHSHHRQLASLPHAKQRLLQALITTMHIPLLPAHPTAPLPTCSNYDGDLCQLTLWVLSDGTCPTSLQVGKTSI